MEVDTAESPKKKKKKKKAAEAEAEEPVEEAAEVKKCSVQKESFRIVSMYGKFKIAQIYF